VKRKKGRKKQYKKRASGGDRRAYTTDDGEIGGCRRKDVGKSLDGKERWVRKPQEADCHRKKSLNADVKKKKVKV